MHVTGAVVSGPTEEDVAASADLGHSQDVITHGNTSISVASVVRSSRAKKEGLDEFRTKSEAFTRRAAQPALWGNLLARASNARQPAVLNILCAVGGLGR
jgi:hypothetical protein